MERFYIVQHSRTPEAMVVNTHSPSVYTKRYAIFNMKYIFMNIYTF